MCAEQLERVFGGSRLITAQQHSPESPRRAPVPGLAALLVSLPPVAPLRCLRRPGSRSRASPFQSARAPKLRCNEHPLVWRATSDRREARRARDDRATARESAGEVCGCGAVAVRFASGSYEGDTSSDQDNPSRQPVRTSCGSRLVACAPHRSLGPRFSLRSNHAVAVRSIVARANRTLRSTGKEHRANPSSESHETDPQHEQ
jgi:hypothetical protein